MALERYVRMREAYEKEQNELGERKEPELGESLGDVYEEEWRADDESVNDEERGVMALSTAQKVMMGLSVLVAIAASVLIYRMPGVVMAEFFRFGIRAPIRMMEILQWNRVLVLLPFLFLMLSFLYNRRNGYLGVKMLATAIASAVLVSGVSAVFSYFVVAVGA